MATTIVRSARRQHFLVIGHEALEDVQLSWAARGLLTYLLSRPDNWRIRVEHLRQQAVMRSNQKGDWRGTLRRRHNRKNRVRDSSRQAFS